MPPSSPLSPEPSDFAMSGDVTLAPSVAIANGVLLHANPDSQIVIGAGVCIGIGAILQAYQGLLEIQVGATIGAGVLIVGSGKVGVNACIGSRSTLINPEVKAEEVVASGSLIGDNSRQLEETGSSETPAQPDPVEAPASEPEKESSTASSPPEPESEAEKPKFPQPKIYGQANLDQLLNSLLPHRKSYNNSRPKSGEISTMGDEQTSIKS